MGSRPPDHGEPFSKKHSGNESTVSCVFVMEEEASNFLAMGKNVKWNSRHKCYQTRLPSLCDLVGVNSGIGMAFGEGGGVACAQMVPLGLRMEDHRMSRCLYEIQELVNLVNTYDRNQWYLRHIPRAS